MGTQSFHSIFVPTSGTGKKVVHTGTERLRTNFVLCSDGNTIVPLTCIPFACSDRNGTERLGTVSLFVSLFWSFHFLERNCSILRVPV